MLHCRTIKTAAAIFPELLISHVLRKCEYPGCLASTEHQYQPAALAQSQEKVIHTFHGKDGVAASAADSRCFRQSLRHDL
jgi:hypothetical protein